jgi:uncharacterized protein (TIGR00730 family)
MDPQANGVLNELTGIIKEHYDSRPVDSTVWEILQTILGLIDDHMSPGDLKLISHALQELRHAARTFGPYRTTRKVTIFGSARIGPGQTDYETAVQFAKAITKRGFMVITGAGPGIMAAGNEGAGKKRSFGVNIRLPFEQTANEFIENDPKLVHFKYFFTRKVTFVKETDALVLFPGGFGTMDEAFEVLTLIQTGKTSPVPVVCLEQPGGNFWEKWDHFIRDVFLGRGLISPNDTNLYTIAKDPFEACDVISRFYSCYHSQRYVGDYLILRLVKPIDNTTLELINDRFGSILKDGEIERCPMLPEEKNEPETAHLHRLRLKFNRKDFGLLRSLIDAINADT